MHRTDYTFPFNIDPGSRQAARASYAAHVEQMVRQVLLTNPGERADLPEFGCGLRRLLFAGNNLRAPARDGPPTAGIAAPSSGIEVTTQVLIQASLNQWLSEQIRLQSVTVTPGPGGDFSQIVVRVAYVLIETQSLQQTQVTVS